MGRTAQELGDLVEYVAKEMKKQGYSKEQRLEFLEWAIPDDKPTRMTCLLACNEQLQRTIHKIDEELMAEKVAVTG